MIFRGKKSNLYGDQGFIYWIYLIQFGLRTGLNVKSRSWKTLVADLKRKPRGIFIKRYLVSREWEGFIMTFSFYFCRISTVGVLLIDGLYRIIMMTTLRVECFLTILLHTFLYLCN